MNVAKNLEYLKFTGKAVWLKLLRENIADVHLVPSSSYLQSLSQNVIDIIMFDIFGLISILHRDAGNGLPVVKFKLCMKASSLRGINVPYKYAVYSNRLDELNDPCEMLYEVPGPSEGASRCLKLPDKVCQAGGIYAFV